MSSTEKTSYLKLNVWSSTDIPKRVDFNTDNSRIDTAFQEHVDDSEKHVTDDERGVWNSPYYVGFYYGDGSLQRTVSTGCPFDPSFGIIFAGGMPPSVTDFNNKIKYNYFGFLSKRAGTSCLTLSGKDIIFSSSGAAVVSGEYISLNNIGATYCYLLFR